MGGCCIVWEGDGKGYRVRCWGGRVLYCLRGGWEGVRGEMLGVGGCYILWDGVGRG